MHEAEEKLRKKKHMYTMYTTVHSVSANGAQKDAWAYANVFLG